ncbi:type I-F CRISPR-associated helicase Cas3 [Rhodanobacter sp. Soil772]|uniref:type I-F CRISPR-associated helicase Cas3f n=1 Tax=Rhodanobacter sp. Soil772 TaxID=1736406 RepID=UPI0006F36BC5|nr:type I-F CRISPR-associated helicase Cas3f [Rhodanobacter sp. Soil772]KRE83516.1 type I-F CRISPR-associated helicase Cas3 [Rhodanobacter sp. Soil772]
MNILLISQCDKRALTETRRILDQFAERRGDRTWQTPITEAGLDTLHKLLRKTARKNTAVACHWIRGRDHSELLWIVGNASRFNIEGAVPTNTTVRNVLRAGDENDWHSAQDIRLLAQLAALLHDLGKASVAFQQRLQDRLDERNRYRHEWVSLRLFLAFVGGDDDGSWLARLASTDEGSEADWTASGRYLRDGLDENIERHPFRNLAAHAPLAAAIGWLIVTHHRLPVIPEARKDGSGQDWLGKRAGRFEPAWLETPLARVAHDWNEIDQRSTPAQTQPYWQLAGELPAVAPEWRAQARRVAKALLDLKSRHDADWLGNPYVMHLSRLCLMLADHHYSSLGVDKDGKPVAERLRFVQRDQTVFANTLRPGVMNQSLLEHLLGVGHTASLIAHALPNFERHLPRLANHRGLRKRSSDARFAWQDKAFDAATSLREAAREHGAFVVNMASTGCGKTLANARILYALADPQLGLRVSYALGLRTLTLQTGRSYRHDLHLNDDELAVLVGGSASRALFEHYEAKAEASGSASVQALIEEDSHVLYEGNVADHPLLSRALANPEIRKLISAPMLVCTVDHLAPATESLRAGRQIAPMLRLMSSDLVLDELDDYDLDDLPALTRLMHWAGMLGSRVVLSSATLPPALVEGMFMAYRAGRRHYQRNRGRDGGGSERPVEVPCLWTDEFGSPQIETLADDGGFAAAHACFVERRVRKLQSAEPLRLAELLPVDTAAQQPERIHAEFASQVRDACLRLHRDHAHADPLTGKRVSFGLVRMANIDPIFDVASALYTHAAPEGTRIHLCVYHARFPLAQRSAIETMLDATFNRRNEDAVWQLPQIRHALDAHPEPEHLFVVLASPVCEVGRDWDADWALAEPSSMRSLIQLAGRVQRHRRKPPQAPNVLVFDTNLKGIKQRDARQPVFARPGFETDRDHGRFLLTSHSLRMLLAEDEYRHLDAQPRILPRATELQPRERWVDLEQARIRAAMLPAPPPPATRSARRSAAPAPRLERDYAPAAWQHPQAALIGVLPQQQPFRHDEQPGTTLAWLPDEDEDNLLPHRVEDAPGSRRGEKLYVPARELLHEITLNVALGISCWGEFDLSSLVSEQAEAQDLSLDLAARRLTTVEVPSLKENHQGWRWHPWLGFTK